MTDTYGSRPSLGGRPLKGSKARFRRHYGADDDLERRFRALAPGMSRGDILVRLVELGERYGIRDGVSPIKPSPFGG